MPDVATPPPEIQLLQVIDVGARQFGLKLKVYAPMHKRAPTDSTRDAWNNMRDLYYLAIMAQGGAAYKVPWDNVTCDSFHTRSCVYKNSSYAGGHFEMTVTEFPRQGRYYVLRLQRDSGYAQKVFEVVDPED